MVWVETIGADGVVVSVLTVGAALVVPRSTSPSANAGAIGIKRNDKSVMIETNDCNFFIFILNDTFILLSVQYKMG